MQRADISIREDEEGSVSHSRYKVKFDNDVIYVFVTQHPEMVTIWLEAMEIFHRPRLDRLIVGLSVKLCGSGSPSRENEVALIQLCIGYRCLLFQTNTSRQMPEKLYEFFGDERYTFVGVGVEAYAEMLEEDLWLLVGGRIFDLRTLAAERRQNDELRELDLEGLTSILLRRSFERPAWLFRGTWDWRQLPRERIMYACLETFLSFRIGRLLNASAW